ncbi:MAG: oxaloacetate decarboxylase [Rhodospirillales bacterium]|nr:oxaloacetate decarboxylase [Rhodospirillales bacterium]
MTVTSTQKRQAFRAVLTGTKCLYPASVFDPISARLAEDIGFETAMMAGSIASQTVLGAPDLIVLTLTEFADQARRINRAGNLPLLVDSDHGYGNALNVKRTVEELEAAGVSALTIEDTDLPQPFGTTKPRLISIEEGVGKMKAALAGRGDPALIIAGRSSAPSVSGLEDTIARAKAYAACGIDAMFLVGLRTRAELDAVAAAVKIPLFLGAGGGELADRDYLASRNVRIALQGHLPFAAAVEATRATMQALRDGTDPANIKGAASAEVMKKVTRDADYRTWMTDFLGAK